jgi:hypothetical protein
MAASCEECYDVAIVRTTNCTFCGGLCVGLSRQSGSCISTLDGCAVGPAIDYQQVATLGGAVISGIVGIGLFGAALLKLWQKNADRKEWREFENSQKAMKFNAKENQLFTSKDPKHDPRSLNRTNVNPLYDEGQQEAEDALDTMDNNSTSPSI